MKMKLAEAQNDWRFVAGNEQPPADRIVLLLEHAARVRPKEAVPITIVALIVFGLAREPEPQSPIVAVVRRLLSSVERRLARRGAELIRLGPGIRAAVDQEDVKIVLGPRREARARSAARRYVEDLGRIPPGCLASKQRAEAVSVLRSIPNTLLSAQNRALRDAWIAAAESRLGEN